MTTSDLSKFYRVPKISITLPSGSHYYAKDEIELSLDDTLPIRAMTARDELMLKSPDALLNGDSLLHVIASCVPQVKDPKKLLAIDVECIILGIFFASYGPTIDFKSFCKECDHENEFAVPIRHMLDLVEKINYPEQVNLEISPETTIVVQVKPYTVVTNTKHQLMIFEQSKLLATLRDDSIDDETKLIEFNKSFSKLSENKFLNVGQCIENITIKNIVNNEETKQVVKDQTEIHEFIMNAESSMIEPVMEKIDQINQLGVNKAFDAKCDKCGHEWIAHVEFNPSSFFAKNFKRSITLR